mmetsp:Transcript_45583/g.119734  ORF Transcript_45583/g.119734 Transcript_45583/m.119734 type:complete len:221 (+) Transcript_45583:68-730(+)
MGSVRDTTSTTFKTQELPPTPVQLTTVSSVSASLVSRCTLQCMHTVPLRQNHQRNVGGTLARPLHPRPTVPLSRADPLPGRKELGAHCTQLQFAPLEELLRLDTSIARCRHFGTEGVDARARGNKVTLKIVLVGKRGCCLVSRAALARACKFHIFPERRHLFVRCTELPLQRRRRAAREGEALGGAVGTELVGLGDFAFCCELLTLGAQRLLGITQLLDE